MAKDNQPTGYYDPQTGTFVPVKKKKKVWPWIVAAVVIVPLWGAFLRGGNSEPAPTDAENASEAEVAETELEAGETEAPETETPAQETKAPENDAPETEIVGNGADPEQWPDIAALGLDNAVMLSLYYDYQTALTPENYPSDFDEAAAYEAKMSADAAKKYNITEKQANMVYSYVLMNFAKVRNDGYPVNTDYKIRYGDLLSVNASGGTVVVKAKISPSYSNKATVNQNYFSVCDMIKNQGLDLYDEIQYWAVADMTNGTEAKVISFTVPADVIRNVKELGKNFPDNTLGNYVTDLWIHPSLEG